MRVNLKAILSDLLPVLSLMVTTSGVCYLIFYMMLRS